MLLTAIATVLLPLGARAHVGLAIFLRVLVGIGTVCLTMDAICYLIMLFYIQAVMFYCLFYKTCTWKNIGQNVLLNKKGLATFTYIYKFNIFK